MTLRDVEKRLKSVEADLAALRAKVERRPKNPRWYRDNAGVFADDPALAEAARLGQEYRDRINRESLQPKKKPKPKATVG